MSISTITRLSHTGQKFFKKNFLKNDRALFCRGGVEDTRLEAKPKATKKSEAKAKDSLFEDRPSRGQGQECSRPRPRTKDTRASVKKKILQKIFSGNLQFIGVPRILIGGGLNHKSHEMTSSKFFQRRSFCETQISQNGRFEIVTCLHVTTILQR